MRFVDHELEGLLAQRQESLALGYEDLNDHAQLRHDPLLAVACDKTDPLGQERCFDDRRGAALAAAATLNRLDVVERVRAWGLAGTELARATVGTVRLKLLKAAALITVSVRRVYVQLSSTYPWPGLFRLCHRRLMSLAAASG